MKLIFAFVQNDDVKPLTRALTENEVNVTRISSSGGFLGGGNSTLMIGVEDVRLQLALDIIKDHSKRRSAPLAASVMPAIHGSDVTFSPVDVSVGGATVFVVDAMDFYKF